MLTKQSISVLRNLHQKKFALEHKLFLAEGEKLVSEAIKSGDNLIKEIVCTESWFYAHPAFIKPEIPVTFATNKQISQISTLITPQEVLAVCNIHEENTNLTETDDKFILYFHDLRDPGNAGTILRIADWFGVSKVFTSTESVFKYNPKLVQSSMGSVFRIGYQSLTIEQLKTLKNSITIWATTLDGESVYETDKKDKGVIMFGSESHGLPEELIALADKKITIPKREGSQAESLNLAISAGIILSHL